MISRKAALLVLQLRGECPGLALANRIKDELDHLNPSDRRDAQLLISMVALQPNQLWDELADMVKETAFD